MAHVTIVVHDQVRERMAAPSIRSVEMARELVKHDHMVTLAIPNEPELDLHPVRQVRDDGGDMADVFKRSDIVIVGGGPYPESPVNTPPRHLPQVIDMSFPLLLEALEMQRSDPRSWPESRVTQMTQQMSERLLRADILLCASEEQRHMYLGWLAALGRLNGAIARADPAISRFLRVVPFGCPAAEPVHQGTGPRSSIPGVDAGDFVLIWNGHVTDWYDPETVIYAVASAARELRNLRLVFIGANAKDERLGRTATGARARALAHDLGLVGRHVFFWDEWVPYTHRSDWLLGSDAAVVASPRTLEAELSVRARFLDCVWCSTPLITTAGGTFAAEVARSQLGIVVNPGDVGAMRDAIITMSRETIRTAIRARFRDIRATHEWPVTLAPLLEYCAAPSVAPDRNGASAEQAHLRGLARHLRRNRAAVSRG